jgi:valyl-tRNA synthetase
LLEKVSDHAHAVGICERSRTIVEPRVSTQWFCKMNDSSNSLAAPAIAAVERGDIEVIPENRREEYLNWMRNIRDWTLSRQLWWGHRIPAWYCKEHHHVTVARVAPGKCATCGSEHLTQDEDVLDTWFSSGLWPMSTLGWPEKTEDFQKYYPTSLLITGYDILFFWVARMIMLGIHFTGEVPFRAVYLHSLVRTAGGEKMSKSKGTGLDPVKLNRQYGTDAMRFCLASMAAPGTDIVLSDDRLASARNFANKIWNASRFLFVNLDKFERSGTTFEELAAPDVREKAPYAFQGSVPLIDEWIFEKLAAARNTVNAALANYRFHEASQVIYQFFWGDFCDWYIEWIKPDLLNSDRERAVVAWRNLFAAFDGALRLLHPIMPFLTEELWHLLPQRAGDKSIALQPFSEERLAASDQSRVNEFALIQDTIAEMRNIRGEMKLPDPKKKMPAEFYSSYEYIRSTVQRNLDGIVRLAGLSELKVSASKLAATGGAVRSTAKFDVRIAYSSDVVDIAGEKTRLRREIEALEKAVASKEKQLSGEIFRSRAPEKIVHGMEATLNEQRLELHKLQTRLSELDRSS